MNRLRPVFMTIAAALLVSTAAVAHHGWDASSYDALAGAVVTGHVLECGAQAMHIGMVEADENKHEIFLIAMTPRH